MSKRKGLLIVGSIVVVVVGGVIAYNSLATSDDTKEDEEHSNPSQIKRPIPVEDPEITVEEATAIIADETGDSQLADLYRTYNDNNIIFLAEDAPCNRGLEALKDFIDRFESDLSFQKERTNIMEGGNHPKYGAVTLSITPPDSINFFGAWNNVTANEAFFCHGWLGSEMLEEFTFTRQDENSEWHLTDYFSALEN